MADVITIRGAREHNLKNVDLELPRDRLIVFTGLSGSGKSSLAFDTIYAEGQRRYVESLSAYARQFLGQMDKPDVDFIEGLSPAISIDQKSASKNPRSTVGTITEIYDYLRLLYARIGVPHCPNCGQVITRQTPQQIVDRVLQLPEGTRFQVLAPVVRGRKGEYEGLLTELAGQGFTRARIDGEVHELSSMRGSGGHAQSRERLARYEQHTIEVVVDRLVRRAGIERRLTDSLETALRLAEGVAEVEIVPREGEEERDEDREVLTFSEHLACANCGLSFEELAPRNFSFNSPYGACERCDGLGTRFEVDPELVVSDDDLSISDGAIAPWAGFRSQYFDRVLGAVAKEYGFSVDTPWRKLRKRDKQAVLHGSGKRAINVRYRNRYGRQRSYTTEFEGVVPWLERRHSEAESDRVREQIEGYMREVPCPACHGARLRPASLAVTVGGKNIYELGELSIAKAAEFLGGLELSERDLMIAEAVLKEVNERLRFLLDVGLNYLSLNRSSATLAGGEAQRIRLASQIGSGLVGRPLRARRAVDRVAPARQPPAPRHAPAPARPREHGDRRRARRGDDARRPTWSSTSAPAPGSTAARSSPAEHSTTSSPSRARSPVSTWRGSGRSRCPRCAASPARRGSRCVTRASTTSRTSTSSSRSDASSRSPASVGAASRRS